MHNPTNKIFKTIETYSDSQLINFYELNYSTLSGELLDKITLLLKQRKLYNLVKDKNFISMKHDIADYY